MTSKKFPILIYFTVICAVDVLSQTILFPDANGNFNIRRKPVIRGSSDPRAKQEPKLSDEEFQTKANALARIEDFVNFYKVNLPKSKPISANISVATRLRAPTSIPDSKELPQAVCMPELTTVPLDLPQEPGVSYFPTCVRVERCGGCCFLSHHSCQPVIKQNVLIKAVKVQEDMTRNRRRRVRNAEPDFVTVEVEQHLECDCQCRLQATECDSAIHIYNEHQCECNCKDSAKEQACLGSRDHFWSYDTCECLCRQTETCSSGQAFNHTTCRCVKSEESFIENNVYDYETLLDFVG